MDTLDRTFYDRPATTVAPELLNKVLMRGNASGRIVEVEAYEGSIDPASHAFRGQTARNAVMFGPPGHLYVYFTYGMHFCCNVVCREAGVASAVLIRALAPLSGMDDMRARRVRAGMGDHHLASGPAKLCQALAIDRSLDGADLVTKDRDVTILSDGVEPPQQPSVGPRIGIRQGTDRMWRFWVAGDRNVSQTTRT
jgi:DNA-3-methyladenine glycosylase